MDNNNKSLPDSCSECPFYTGNTDDDVCGHSTMVGDDWNINPRPERSRMNGCPLEDYDG